MIRFILIVVASFLLDECILPQDSLTFYKEDKGKRLI